MEIQHHIIVAFLTTLIYSLACIEGLKPSLYSSLLNRRSFPVGFVFGAASSAYQLEGATDTDGRRPSIWDTFVRENPEKILDHSNGDVADEFYYSFKEDIALMKGIGLGSFRFSISWPRILPQGKISGGANQPGVDFYSCLINELISNGIQPSVTLFHWDLPQALEDEYGGFLSADIVNDFRDYAEFCFKEFGDRVKHWVTFNEPNLFSAFGYGNGANAPGRCSNYIGNCTAGNSATEPYIVAHHLILSHATVAKLYKEKFKASQGGAIGFTTQTFWMVPKYETIASRKAVNRAIDFSLGWLVHPVTYGDYPKIMQDLVGERLPKFTKEQSEMIKGSLDFLGVNYYTARYADDAVYSSTLKPSYTTDSRVNETTEKHGIPIGQLTGASWLYLYPQGIRDLLLYIKRKYGSLPIYITENGMADVNNSSLPIHAALKDDLRIKYHHLHLSYLLESIKDGIDVRGYYVWSFLDDFEWQFGYTNRYGMTYVDYQDGLKRYLKNSALWFKKFLLSKDVKTTGLPLLYSQ